MHVCACVRVSVCAYACVCVFVFVCAIHACILWVLSLLDPSVKTRDENLTSLHLAAHYRPRYYCENIQSSISARSSIVNEERHSSSEKAVRLLVNHPNVDVRIIRL